MVDRLSGLTMNAYQIGLEFDASLLLIDCTPHPLASVVLKPSLADVYVGLSTTLLTHEGPHVLATWSFLRLPGFAPDHAASICMRDLENGTVSEYRGTAPVHHRAAFRDAGPVVIGDAAPAVTRFLATPLDPVRDREYEIEWETYGLADLRLDDEAVPASGRRAHVAAGTREHVLQWNEGSDSRELVLKVDAIEEPLIEILRFDPPPPEAPNLFGVEWVVRGAHAVWWSPGDELVSSRGERGVTIDGPSSITLRAENEWGTVTRSVALRSGGEPVIASFWAEPGTIDRGDRALLRWSVVDAEHVFLEPFGVEVPADGSWQVAPDSTTTYTLRAQGGGIEVESECSIDVMLLRIERFGIDVYEVYPGNPVTLEWAVVNADSVWIEPGVGPVDPVAGSVAAFPPTAQTIFTLHAANETGEVNTTLQTRWIPPFASLTLSPPTPREFLPYQTEIEGADSARVDPGAIRLDPVNGSNTVLLPGHEAQTFRLTATNAAGQTISEHRYVPMMPTAMVSERNLYGGLGRLTHVTVVASLATEVEFDAPGTLAAPMHFAAEFTRRFSIHFWLDEPRSFRVRAENFMGEVIKAMTLGGHESYRANAWVDEPVLQRGDSTTLHWLHGNAVTFDKVVVEPLGIEGGRSGTLTIQPDATTQYEVISSYRMSDGGTPRYRRLVTVVVADGATSLVAEPMRPIVGTPFTLRIEMPEDATSAYLEPHIGAIDPRSQSLERLALSVEEYRLTVTTPRGPQSAAVWVEPEGVEIVSSLVQNLNLSARPRGPRVAVQWDVETTRPPRSMRLYRAEGEESLQPWLDLSDPKGELIDVDVRAGVTYSYQVRLEFDTETHESMIVSARPDLRLRTLMLPNVPNPFNPSTEIRWELATAGPTQLALYDLRGRLVRSVDLGPLAAGSGSWTWDGIDDRGGPAASGTYIARLSSGPGSVAQKIVLIR